MIILIENHKKQQRKERVSRRISNFKSTINNSSIKITSTKTTHGGMILQKNFAPLLFQNSGSAAEVPPTRLTRLIMHRVTYCILSLQTVQKHSAPAKKPKKKKKSNSREKVSSQILVFE